MAEMITHFRYMADNVKDFPALTTKDFPLTSFKKMKAGELKKLGLIEKISNRYGLSIGEVFVRPGENSEPWKNSSLAEFPSTFQEYIEASSISRRELERLAGVPSSNFLKYIYGDCLPVVGTVQKLADFWSIEISDMFVAPKAENVEKIRSVMMPKQTDDRLLMLHSKANKDVARVSMTNIIWLESNMSKALKMHRVKDHDEVLGEIMREARKNLKAVEYYANRYGLSIGDMFVRPEVQTEWYRESSLIFMSHNLEAEVISRGMTIAALAEKCLYSSSASVYKFIYGPTIPTMSQLQEIANVLDVEISDLFLPVDGLEY